MAQLVGRRQGGGQHPLGRLLGSRQEGRSAGRGTQVGLLALAVLGYLAQRQQLLGLEEPAVFLKDFKQEYLLARAVLDGANPYVPASVLAERYLPESLSYVPANVIPHPPLVAALSTPLGLLSYQAASVVWLGLEAVFLLLSLLLIARGLRWTASAAGLFTLYGILLLWPPVWGGLLYGQLSTSLTFLLVGCWLALKRGRDGLAGMLVGLAAAIKLVPLALVAYFLIKRRWRPAAWAVGTFVAAFLLGATVIGLDGLRSYVADGLPVAAYYRAAEGNHSLFGAVWRLFAGSLQVEPALDLAFLAAPVATLASALLLLEAGRRVLRANDLDLEYSLVICAVLLASPLTWQHYFLMALPALCVAADRLYRHGWDRVQTNLLLATVLMLSLPPGPVLALSSALAQLSGANPSRLPLPAVAGLPLVLLPIGLILLYVLLARQLAVAPRREADSTEARMVAPAPAAE